MKGIDLQTAGADAAKTLADAAKEAQPLVVKYALGDEGRVVGLGTVSAVGVRFYKNGDRKHPVSVKASGPITLDMLVDKFVGHCGVFDTAIWVRLPDKDGVYHEVEIAAWLGNFGTAVPRKVGDTEPVWGKSERRADGSLAARFYFDIGRRADAAK